MMSCTYKPLRSCCVIRRTCPGVIKRYSPGRPPAGDPGETEEVVWEAPLGGKGLAGQVHLVSAFSTNSLRSLSTHITIDKNCPCNYLFTVTCPSSPLPWRCREGKDNVSLVFSLETSPVNL